jgi:hypothetical protein
MTREIDTDPPVAAADGGENAKVSRGSAEVTASVTALYSALGHELGNSLHPLRLALESTQRALRESGASPAKAPDVWEGMDHLHDCLAAALGVLDRMASLALADTEARQLDELAPVDLGERALLAIDTLRLSGVAEVEFGATRDASPPGLARGGVVDRLISDLLEIALTVARDGAAARTERARFRLTLANDEVQSTLTIAFPAPHETEAELRAALDPFAGSRPAEIADRHVTLFALRSIAGRMNGDLRLERMDEREVAFQLSFVRADVLGTT